MVHKVRLLLNMACGLVSVSHKILACSRFVRTICSRTVDKMMAVVCVSMHDVAKQWKGLGCGE